MTVDGSIAAICRQIWNSYSGNWWWLSFLRVLKAYCTYREPPINNHMQNYSSVVSRPSLLCRIFISTSKFFLLICW